MTDILGQALADYHFHNAKSKLWIHNRYGEKEQMPIAAYFREEVDMPDLEWLALEKCEGRVLDIGAGAGSHALLLQDKGLDVLALDISPLAVEVMRVRGIKNTLVADIFTYNNEKFDTLLLLMNGIGLAGDMENLRRLLLHFKTLLNDGGQLLFDSSDIAYLYEASTFPTDKYYGELTYQYEYKKQQSDWFPWLYIDEKTMQREAQTAGYKMEVLLEDEFGQYLARLTVV
jgi:SAM-dependent methyltransferase